MKFARKDGYYATTTATRRYDIQRWDGAWLLRIWTVKNIAGLTIADAMVESDTFDTKADTKADAVAVATAYDALTDDYRPCDNGYRTRYTTAIRNAFM